MSINELVKKPTLLKSIRFLQVVENGDQISVLDEHTVFMEYFCEI